MLREGYFYQQDFRFRFKKPFGVSRSNPGFYLSMPFDRASGQTDGTKDLIRIAPTGFLCWNSMVLLKTTPRAGEPTRGVVQ